MTERSARAARWGLVTGVVLAAAGLSSPSALAAAAAAPAAGKVVSYRGYRFEVPAGWPVIRVSRTSATCVRFDRHAIYLGEPGPDEACPSGLLGTTEAILVQPAAGVAAAAVAQDPVARRITVVSPGIDVTATYDTNRALVTGILASAGLPAATGSKAGPLILGAVSEGAADRAVVGQARAADAAQQMLTPAAAATTMPASATSYLGEGFDACTAPSAAFMTAWKKSSPYGAVGIYIGGAERACAQPNLTAGWVAQQAAAGWHFLPTYVGPQAEFGQITAPASQAVAAAQDAVTQAAALGFGPGTPIYYDMEAYPAGQASGALAFLSAWTTQLHAEGYKSAVYSSSSSGVTDLADNATRDVMPDVIWDALWNGAANTADAVIPAGDWANHQRAHQFNGGANETFAGDTIDVDQDYLDVSVLPPAPVEEGQSALATFTGLASDYVIRHRNLYAYYQARPGGAFAGPRKLTATRNLTGTPVAVQTANGTIWVFARTTGGGIKVVAQAAPGGTVTRTVNLSGHLTGSPAAIAAQDGTAVVYAIGTDRNLYSYYQAGPGGAFRGPERLTTTGNLTGTPTAVQTAKGVISVYARTTGGAVKAVWQSVAGGPVTKSANLGGHLAGSPAAVITSDGAIAVYAIGTNGHLYGYEQPKPGARFAGPSKLTVTGGLVGTPVAVPGADGTAVVYFLTVRGLVRAKWQSAAYGPFVDSASLGGRVSGLAGVVAGAAGPVSLYATAANGRQYRDQEGGSPRSFGGWAVI